MLKINNSSVKIFFVLLLCCFHVAFKISIVTGAVVWPELPPKFKNFTMVCGYSGTYCFIVPFLVELKSQVCTYIDSFVGMSVC